MRIVRTRRGARLVERGLVLSEILGEPGPTHSLFDVLAVAVAALGGSRTLVLGFAGGGVVAPLRAMGHGHPIDAVDLSTEAEPLFRELSEPWCGQVRLFQAEAANWLRRTGRRYDVILEDLSAPHRGDISKPPVSLEVLPALMKRRLRPRGLAVTNVLPVPGWPWTRLLPHLARPFDHAQAILLDDWENRVLLAGDALAGARETSRHMRETLRAIGSREAHRFRVRTLK